MSHQCISAFSALMPLTVSCFSKIQIGFTFLVLADLDSPGKGPLNGCVCVCGGRKLRSCCFPEFCVENGHLQACLCMCLFCSEQADTKTDSSHTQVRSNWRHSKDYTQVCLYVSFVLYFCFLCIHRVSKDHRHFFNNSKMNWLSNFWYAKS